MSRDPRELYHKLAAMAANVGATDAERGHAQRLMDRLVAKHGEAVKAWGQLILVPISPADAQLILHTAASHACGVRQEPTHFTIEGTPESIARVKADYAEYSVRLKDILQVAMIGALKGFGVYCEGPEQAAPKEEVKPAFPYDVQGAVTNLFGAAHHIGRRFVRPDYTLKQLPRPRPVYEVPKSPQEYSIPTLLQRAFPMQKVLGHVVVGDRPMEVRGDLDREMWDLIFGKK